MNKLYSIVVLVLTCVFLGCAVSAGETGIGGVKVQLPEFPGFVEASSVSEALHTHLSQFTVAENIFLTAFVETADAERVTAKELPLLTRYVLLNTPKALSTTTVTPEIFLAVKNSLKQTLGTMKTSLKERLEQEAKTISRNLSTPEVPLEYRFKEVVPLGIGVNEDRLLNFSMQIVSEGFVGAKKFEQVVFCSASVILVSEKLMYIYAYKKYSGPEDAEEARKDSLDISRKILQANAPEKSKSKK